MELKFILEAILLSAEKPLSARELRDVFVGAADEAEDAEVKARKKIGESELSQALDELCNDWAGLKRSFQLVCVAGAWQFVSHSEYAPWLRFLSGVKNRPPRLSQPALETLAIIAYRQPSTRAEIEQIRGVSIDGVMQTLLERELIETAGRAEVPGHPMTYATTRAFLEYFGLRSLDELPAADELRRIAIKHPEELVTAEPGLATTPPAELVMEPVPGGAASDAPENPSATATDTSPNAGTTPDA